MNLKAGDLVNIVRDANHSLTIVPNSTKFAADSLNEATALITQIENENSLKRKVISMYYTSKSKIRENKSTPTRCH
jgi:hypothetical protein